MSICNTQKTVQPLYSIEQVKLKIKNNFQIGIIKWIFIYIMYWSGAVTARTLLFLSVKK